MHFHCSALDQGEIDNHGGTFLDYFIFQTCHIFLIRWRHFCRRETLGTKTLTTCSPFWTQGLMSFEITSAQLLYEKLYFWHISYFMSHLIVFKDEVRRSRAVSVCPAQEIWYGRQNRFLIFCSATIQDHYIWIQSYPLLKLCSFKTTGIGKHYLYFWRR